MQKNEKCLENSEIERLFENVSFTESQKNMYRGFDFIHEKEHETPTFGDFLDVFDLDMSSKEKLKESYKAIHIDIFNEAFSDLEAHCEDVKEGVNLWFPLFGMITFYI